MILLHFAASVVLVASILQGCSRSPREKRAAFLKRREALIAAKQYSRAILQFRNAITAMRKEAEPYYQLRKACLQAGDVFDAFRAFHQAAELDPTHSRAQLKVAELLNLTQNDHLLPDPASRVSSILLASPDDEEATDAQLAITEFQMGKGKESTRRLAESLEKFPSRLKSSKALARIL